MSEHVKAQVLRFFRVGGMAFLAALLSGGNVTWASVLGAAAGGLEAGLRQVLPVKALPAISSALSPPGVTAHPAVSLESQVLPGAPKAPPGGKEVGSP